MQADARKLTKILEEISKQEQQSKRGAKTRAFENIAEQQGSTGDAIKRLYYRMTKENGGRLPVIAEHLRKKDK